MRLAEQALRLLIDRLDEILLFIEPDKAGLNTYSHKTRELLILACTEVENVWKSFMDKLKTKPLNKKTFTTNDYVKLVDKLHLKEYEFELKTYKIVPPLRPFANWLKSKPTASLTWYDAYNKTKHDRDQYFSQSTLLNCLNAVAANLIMHCVKFSPFPIFEQSNTFSSLINQHFEARLIKCDFQSMYIHEVDLPVTREDLFVFDPRKKGFTKPFITDPLVL